jgi:hypothetical protein
MWTDLPRDKDCCECGNEPSCFIKGGEFVDQLSDCQLLKEAVLHRVSQSVSQSGRQAVRPSCE